VWVRQEFNSTKHTNTHPQEYVWFDIITYTGKGLFFCTMKRKREKSISMCSFVIFLSFIVSGAMHESKLPYCIFTIRERSLIIRMRKFIFDSRSLVFNSQVVTEYCCEKMRIQMNNKGKMDAVIIVTIGLKSKIRRNYSNRFEENNVQSYCFFHKIWIVTMF